MNRGLFFPLLKQHAGKEGLKVLGGAILSGVLQGVTLLVVGFALDGIRTGEISFRYFLLFLFSVSAYFLCYRYAVGRSTTVALDMVSALQMQLTNALKKLPLRNYEQLDEGQVYQEILGNKDIVVEATRFVVLAVSGSALMVVAFLMATWISITGFLVIISALVFSILFLSFIQHDVVQLQQKAQKLDESFVRSLKDLVFGFTELKMSKSKQDELLEDVIHARAVESKDVKLEAERVYIKGLSFFNSFVFFPVAAIVFILPGFVDLPFDDSIKLIGISLFSIGPLSSIVVALPVLSKAEMTLRNLRSFQDSLESLGEVTSDEPVAPFDFHRIELQKCSFHYHSNDGLPQFSLHVDQFSLKKNEVVFLTGGNGSGKTSLMKVFAGLYPMTSGMLLVDDRPLDEIGLHNYRNAFSIVLLNFHLFEKLYGIIDVDENYCNKLLGDMQLKKKVRLENGTRFSSTTLSSGQRKRLAVVAACLEKKDILLFDEVAADFDPHFRKFFYEEFIPKLKNSGKTILAISHDDRYFHVADRVVTMRYGKIVES